MKRNEPNLHPLSILYLLPLALSTLASLASVPKTNTTNFQKTNVNRGEGSPALRWGLHTENQALWHLGSGSKTLRDGCFTCLNLTFLTYEMKTVAEVSK